MKRVSQQWGLTIGLLTLFGWPGILPVGAAELTLQQLYAQAAPAVVMVMAYPTGGKGGSGGAGSIIRADGLVLTNAHVVIQEGTTQPYPSIQVYLKPDRVTGDSVSDLALGYRASVQAFSIPLDLAVLTIQDPPPGLAVVPLGDSDRVRIGDRVAAIGHPEQGGLWTFTTGVISAEFENFRNVQGKHVFQTETGLNRGNSGGPLLDMKGEVVAINTAIARLASDGMPITAISFAVKADVARDWLDGVGVTGNRALPSPDLAPDRPPDQQTGKSAGPPQETPPPPSGVTADEGRRAPAGAGGAETSPTSGPQIHTPVRPYDMDQLMSERQAAQREMEDLLKDMRDSMRRKSSR